MYKKTLKLLIALIVLMGVSNSATAQTQPRWLSVGSLNNFFMPVGNEREHALVTQQQFGLQWPAVYNNQNSQAAKGLWIGTTDFTDANGVEFPYKIVHAGPRTSGLDTFFPMEHKLIGRFGPTDVFVDGDESFNNPDEVDEVDPNLSSDRMIYTRVNTALGITMERKIMQFTNEFHDNYYIKEYIFTNTGKADNTDNVIFPNKTLENVRFFWQYRYSVVNETRYVIGNASGWGKNAMTDRIGDGLGPDYGANPRLSGHFTWHGLLTNPPAIVDYNHIGGPIWTGANSADIAADDTTGRLGAYHFVGNAFLHIDTAPDNPTHDASQPSTMTEVESDDDLNRPNDSFNVTRMQQEYRRFMSAGRTPRHAFLVTPSGVFEDQTQDPSRGTSGGFSAASGVGPYTLAPGESVRIVKVEGVSGIGRRAAQVIGEAFKRSGGDDDLQIPYEVDGTVYNFTKNEWVFQGRDSLMLTFNRALENFLTDFSAPKAPVPPRVFNVDSGGDGIYLSWEYPESEVANIQGFEVFRAGYRRDSTYVRVATLGPGVREFADTDDNPVGGPIRGIDYYYYIQAIGLESANTGNALTPNSRALRSNRYFTQTYDPAFLRRQPGESMDQIVVVPNPYIDSAGTDVSFERSRIFFFEVPGRARIDIYTEMGELVQTINHTDGSGDAEWNLNTASRQRIVSGVYIARILNLDTGERVTRKFVVIM
ncbi:MAG: T9SS type A sorting domain-containing protein [Bacteroidetes bacterium]|nr:T9SS type A sorting domain-containing protein [Bacteroidota bacterium]